MSENEFIDGEREIRKKYNLLLLVDLIYYYYKCNVDIEINNIVNSLQDSLIYESGEREELIKLAKKMLLEKYKISL